HTVTASSCRLWRSAASRPNASAAAARWCWSQPFVPRTPPTSKKTCVMLIAPTARGRRSGPPGDRAPAARASRLPPAPPRPGRWGLMAGEHVLRVLLALGDVGLVERIEAHDCPRDGGCELPAEKLLAEIVSVLERQPDHGVSGGHEGVKPCLGRIVLLTRKRERYEDTVAPVHLGRAQRLCGDGQDPLPLLAGALRDQLLDPQPEAPDPPRQDDRGLVAAR